MASWLSGPTLSWVCCLQRLRRGKCGSSTPTSPLRPDGPVGAGDNAAPRPKHVCRCLLREGGRRLKFRDVEVGPVTSAPAARLLAPSDREVLVHDALVGPQIRRRAGEAYFALFEDVDAIGE